MEAAWLPLLLNEVQKQLNIAKVCAAWWHLLCVLALALLCSFCCHEAHSYYREYCNWAIVSKLRYSFGTKGVLLVTSDSLCTRNFIQLYSGALFNRIAFRFSTGYKPCIVNLIIDCTTQWVCLLAN